ncbi:MAG: PLP-dependent transferase [Deinococcales bacterium]
MDDGLRFDSLAVRAENHLPNPLAQLEARLGVLEASGLAGRGSAWCVSFTSGRAALDSLARVLRPMDKVLLHFETGGLAVRTFSALAEWDVHVELTDLGSPETRFEGASMVYLENPSSATLTPFALSQIAQKAHDAGALLVVDNSFLTMFACRPLEFGADAVVYSSAAALTGDTTLALGAVIGRSEELQERIRRHRDTVGARPNAQICGGALRAIKTLSVRLERQNASAQSILPKLEAHPAPIGVSYPSAEAHLTRDGREMGGSAIALEFAVPEAARAFLEHLRYFENNDWVGSSENSVCQPSRSSHRALEALGLSVSECVVRLSFGLEDAADIWRALESALDAAFEATPEPAPEEPDEPEGDPHPPLPALDDVGAQLETAALERFIRLRNWRDQTALSEGISRFLVMSNAILADIATTKPDSLEQLSDIKGIGKHKIARYGTAVLEILAAQPQTWLELMPNPEVSAPMREKPNAVPVARYLSHKRIKQKRKKGQP